MILKGSQRGGGSDLAAHLLRLDENEHSETEEVRGFVSKDLKGTFAEAYAVSKATRCKQYLFSLSVNPPKDADISKEDLIAAIEAAEQRLGLTCQPRVIQIHVKNGRRHAHAAWSRIDRDKLKAINLPFFKTRLAELSKELFLKRGLELPDGHKQKGKSNPLNYGLAEGQLAKRLGLDPKQLKQVFQQAWKNSSDLETFQKALAQQGFTRARGDRRGLVALTPDGKVLSVSRFTGVRPKDLRARLGDTSNLPTIRSATDRGN